MRQSEDDLQTHLSEQIAFLKNSTKSYDEGFDGEAKRMATAIRVLVHDTPKSASLLAQLALKQIEFYDTAPTHRPDNIMATHGLISVVFGGGADIDRGGIFVSLFAHGR